MQAVRQVEQLRSGTPAEVYGALRAIKNAVIGSSAQKAVYIELALVPSVCALVAQDDTDAQSREQATAIIGSLAHRSAKAAVALAAGGAVDALVRQLAPAAGDNIHEASARALNALLAHDTVQADLPDSYIAEAAAHLVRIIRNTVTAKRMHEMRGHARIEQATLALARLCTTSARQFSVAEAGAIDELGALLASGLPRLQAAALQALAALAYENDEAAIQVSAYDDEDMGIRALVRHRDPLVRLQACVCLANLSRVRGGARCGESGSAVPALVGLLEPGPDPPALEAVRALAYLCHEDADMQAAATNAGAAQALLRIQARIDDAATADDFADHDAHLHVTRAVFMALGTLVSAGEDSRAKAVTQGALPHVVRALGHSDAHVRAAACMCAQYIARSVPLCRTHVADSGLLQPLLRLVRTTGPEQAPASAALINLLPDFSPLRADAIKAGVVGVLVSLLDTPLPPPAVRRNALWGLRNLLVAIDDDARRDIASRIGVDRLASLAADDSDPRIREQAAGVLQNISAESSVGARIVADALEDAPLRWLLRRLLAPPADTPVHVHALYLANNLIVRLAATARAIVADHPLLHAIVAHARSPASEVAIAALWCIHGIAADRSDPPLLAALTSMDVQSMLETMLADPALCLAVRDRVKSCLDFFH
ncbi:hypothetical protein GGF46_001287 [Coemansia sp. RSA 552]|nr:hypothetical protein GGF46_001287 [Coemansia sp. RSA 552]